MDSIIIYLFIHLLELCSLLFVTHIGVLVSSSLVHTKITWLDVVSRGRRNQRERWQKDARAVHSMEACTTLWTGLTRVEGRICTTARCAASQGTELINHWISWNSRRIQLSEQTNTNLCSWKFILDGGNHEADNRYVVGGWRSGWDTRRWLFALVVKSGINSDWSPVRCRPNFGRCRLAIALVDRAPWMLAWTPETSEIIQYRTLCTIPAVSLANCGHGRSRNHHYFLLNCVGVKQVLPKLPKLVLLFNIKHKL
jgi:hypothetical protein